MKKFVKEQKGITLIALIITIIVMLILVAVTINVALNGGLFGKANKSAKDTEMQSVYEQTVAAMVIDENGDFKVNETGNAAADYFNNNTDLTATYDNKGKLTVNGKKGTYEIVLSDKGIGLPTIKTGGSESKDETRMYGTYKFIDGTDEIDLIINEDGMEFDGDEFDYIISDDTITFLPKGESIETAREKDIIAYNFIEDNGNKILLKKSGQLFDNVFLISGNRSDYINEDITQSQYNEEVHKEIFTFDNSGNVTRADNYGSVRNYIYIFYDGKLYFDKFIGEIQSNGDILINEGEDGDDQRLLVKQNT